VRLTDVRTGQPHEVRFVAGLLGVVQGLATRALQPEFGWAVVREEVAAPAEPGMARPRWRR